MTVPFLLVETNRGSLDPGEEATTAILGLKYA